MQQILYLNTEIVNLIIAQSQNIQNGSHDWIELLFNGGGIATGIIAGVVAAVVQMLLSFFEHRFIERNRKKEQAHDQLEWIRDEIAKMIAEVSAIKIPAITVTDEDIIDNAYHLIIADFERSKPLLYKKNETITIKGFFNTLNYRYEQMQNIKLGREKRLELSDSKRVLIGEIKECKARLLKELQSKEKEVISKL